MKTALYHYTCFHRAKEILVTHEVIPMAMLRPDLVGTFDHPLPWAQCVSWFTDMPTPDRDALGLTSHTLKCDRTEARFLVDEPERCVPFLLWTRRRLTPAQRRKALLSLTGDPAHWYVSMTPVLVSVP